MPDLNFGVDSARPAPYAAAPALAFQLRVTQAPDGGEPLTPLHSVILRCQVRIDPARRRYNPREQAALVDLFGEPHRWGQTVKGLLWENLTAVLPPFTDEVAVDLLLPCSFDFNIATTKYFHALEDGQVPISLLFSGTMFYAGEDGGLQVAQISWEKETQFRLPVDVWKQMMAMYYPNVAWLCLRQDVFDRLYQYKSRRMLPTWEQCLESLLAAGADAEAQEEQVAP